MTKNCTITITLDDKNDEVKFQTTNDGLHKFEITTMLIYLRDKIMKDEFPFEESDYTEKIFKLD